MGRTGVAGSPIASPHEARAAVIEQLVAARWPVGVIHVAGWLTAELAASSNRVPGRSVVVAIDLTRDVVRVEVTELDHAAGPSSDDGPDLRLHLLAQATTSWGVTSTKHGTTVWFELERS